jgi:hypothetical protein
VVVSGHMATQYTLDGQNFDVTRLGGVRARVLLCFVAGDAQALHAAPSHLLGIISGRSTIATRGSRVLKRDSFATYGFPSSYPREAGMCSSVTSFPHMNLHHRARSVLPTHGLRVLTRDFLLLHHRAPGRLRMSSTTAGRGSSRLWALCRATFRAGFMIWLSARTPAPPSSATTPPSPAFLCTCPRGERFQLEYR